MLGLEGLGTEPDRDRAVISQKYRPAIELVIARCDRVLDGAPPASDGNSVWDWELSFLLGRELVSQPGEGSTPVRVVSSDRALHRAAAAAGDPDTILDLAEYRAAIHW